ncbi:chemotaxis protein CheX [Candidatus Halobeggiatoa sp. HSG11]|nr:chemotaxis protein CheX [Candidatus Halobeggiatoa sp. HSG11]
MDDDIHLSELQHDAVVELLNIGMGSAVCSLSEIVNEEIKLSIPSLKLLHRQEVIEYFETLSQDIVAIRQSFQGAFNGDSLLAFAQDKGIRLVSILMKHQVSTEELAELEADAVKEIGNIILNSCLATCSNVLGEKLITEIPIFMKGTATEIFNKKLATIVMFLHIKFSLQNEDIDGYVAFILKVSAIEQLKMNIDKYLSKNI